MADFRELLARHAQLRLVIEDRAKERLAADRFKATVATRILSRGLMVAAWWLFSCGLPASGLRMRRTAKNTQWRPLCPFGRRHGAARGIAQRRQRARRRRARVGHLGAQLFQLCRQHLRAPTRLGLPLRHFRHHSILRVGRGAHRLHPFSRRAVRQPAQRHATAWQKKRARVRALRALLSTATRRNVHQAQAVLAASHDASGAHAQASGCRAAPRHARAFAPPPAGKRSFAASPASREHYPQP